MKCLMSRVLCLSACGLLASSIAMACGNSTIPNWITLVGTHWDPTVGRLVPQGDNRAGGASRDPLVTITVRDFNNDPVPDAEVVVSFENCDAQLCAYALGEGEGSVSCTVQNGRIVARSSAQGRVSFVALGSANAVPPAGGVQTPGAGAGPRATMLSCVEIVADGVILGYAQFNAWDLNGPSGGNGVSALDESYAIGNAVLYSIEGAYRTRSDYNRDGANTSTDNALLKGIRQLGLSASGCPGAYCP